MGGYLGGLRRAANTEEFEKACKEECVKFNDMENVLAYKKLFPSSDTSEAHIYRQVDMFTVSGLYVVWLFPRVVNFKCSADINKSQRGKESLHVIITTRTALKPYSSGC